MDGEIARCRCIHVGPVAGEGEIRALHHQLGSGVFVRLQVPLLHVRVSEGISGRDLCHGHRHHQHLALVRGLQLVTPTLHAEASWAAAGEGYLGLGRLEAREHDARQGTRQRQQSPRGTTHPQPLRKDPSLNVQTPHLAEARAGRTSAEILTSRGPVARRVTADDRAVGPTLGPSSLAENGPLVAAPWARRTGACGSRRGRSISRSRRARAAALSKIYANLASRP